MNLYQGSLRSKAGHYLDTVALLADNEAAATEKLSALSCEISLELIEDREAYAACQRSSGSMAVGVGNFSLTSQGKVGEVMWLPISDFEHFNARLSEKAQEQGYWLR